MVLAVDRNDVEYTMEQIKFVGEQAYVIGEIIENEKEIGIL